jgi:hypothetical protein
VVDALGCVVVHGLVFGCGKMLMFTPIPTPTPVDNVTRTTSYQYYVTVGRVTVDLAFAARGGIWKVGL